MVMYPGRHVGATPSRLSRAWLSSFALLPGGGSCCATLLSAIYMYGLWIYEVLEDTVEYLAGVAFVIWLHEAL